MSCLQVESLQMMECKSYPQVNVWAECYVGGWILYLDTKPIKTYTNPHYEKWGRGRPTKQAKAKRIRADNWMPEEWLPVGHADGSQSHRVQTSPCLTPSK